ncbi:DUF1254 domain-containing protein [Thalassolituus oleivorans]|uniref:DUF1254 domain-containing protein n=1 Tax=Thalassolituus oleivorans TaxID=187493 RepID=UPI00240A7368|nr:DUF1254 domain-containing protein [Thalassolituus oleivorans]MDF1642265.1 DUF1254 domain-containing protein [Thalassolituus oleivorans]
MKQVILRQVITRNSACAASNRWRFQRGILTLLLSLMAFNAYSLSTSAIATMGYIYGFPIVLMDETKLGLTGEQRSCTLGTDINTLVNVFDIPDSNFEAVVRPNVDTLYTSAMLDLSSGVQLLDMPAVSDRYVLMALLDAWSNNFAGIGTQTHGESAGQYAIAGPDWSGDVDDIPQGYELIEAPTNLVWLVGRTELKGLDDVAAVNAIQKQYRLYSANNPSKVNPISSPECLPDEDREPPIDVVKSLSGEEFFSRLSALMISNPPPEEDSWMVNTLGTIGVGPMAKGDVSNLSKLQKKQLDIGIATAQVSLDTSLDLLSFGGWGPNPALVPLGDYGTRYFIRAVVAQVGFGANKGKFAVYQNASRDDRLERLNGENNYTLTFNKNELPPVKAFWSLTVYADDGFLTDNRAARMLGITRFALGSNDELIQDDEGNITLYLASIPPLGAPLSNWLPTPKGNFQVTIRLYDPESAILENEWQVPSLIKEDRF